MMTGTLDVDHLTSMLRIRMFEESLVELRDRNEIFGTFHPYVGQEAVAVGVCSVLRPHDVITSTHRGHGHLLARGARLDRSYAELMGRVDGYCKGRGGSMHIASVDLGMLGANGIVAAGAPLAVGAGFAARHRGDQSVAVCFFGDGATGEGVFWEALNLASVMKLPVVWVCENNAYASETPLDKSLPHPMVSELISPHFAPSAVVDGNVLGDVIDAASEAVDRARAGEGPQLIEALTFRTLWHSYSVKSRPDSRPEALRRHWQDRDPIALYSRLLRESGLIDDAGLEQLRSSLQDELAVAIEFARASEWPQVDSVFDDVFSA
jgi:TPP-dependent pyruvate/acetoin dehydrogenase alpha subunit